MLDAELCKRVREQTSAALINVYGPTEATVDALWHEWRAEDGETVPIGRPIANVRAYVLDEQRQPVPAGVTGELYLGGAGVARGYLSRPELTAERFIAEPVRRRRRGCTGRATACACAATARSSIWGASITRSSCAAIASSSARSRWCWRRSKAWPRAWSLVREDVPADQRLVAYVVAATGAAPATAALRDALKAKLPEYMVPSAFVVLDALPLLPSGKIDRQALPAPDGRAAAARPVVRGPAAGDRGALGEHLERRPRHRAVGRPRHFFEIGGHSLLATQVAARIRAAFGVELALKTLFELPSLAELAQAIAAAQARGELAIPPLQAGPRPDALPLSFAQQRLWFLDQLEPGSAAYNTLLALRLRGRLDVEALRRTLETMVERHEALRTTFASHDGEPVQRIAGPAAWSLPCIDLDSAEALDAHALAEAEQPFDLATGPLLRTTLVHLGDEEHVLLATTHHIISDGWSLGVLVREMMALYPAYAAGKTPSLPPLPVQYADFALWQRGWLRGELLAQQLGYWRERLAGVPALALPTDRPRPARRQPSRRHACIRAAGRAHAPAAPARARPRRDAVHDAVGGVRGAPAALHGTDGLRRRNADCQPYRREAGAADRVLRQHAGAAGERRRQSELRRAARARAQRGARRLRPPVRPVRADRR